jgi:hypothetical protein
LFISTNPGGAARAWHKLRIPGRPAFDAVACYSRRLCVAAGGRVDRTRLFVSTNPTGSGDSWRAVSSDPGLIDLISCASANLCIAADDTGHFISSTHPAAGPRAWTRYALSPRDEVGALGLACPSSRLCLAGYNGQLELTTDPAAGAAGWHAVTPVAGGGGVVACASVALCITTNEDSASTSTDPAGGAATWAPATAPPDTPLDALSCPSTSLCVGISGEHLIVGKD